MQLQYSIAPIMQSTHHALFPDNPIGRTPPEHEPLISPSGLRIANPSMMALCNLLHHPCIGPKVIRGSSIKRSNKDLGGVLALAYLTQEKDRDALKSWPVSWAHVLASKYSNRSKALLAGIGGGLRQLLRSPEDMEQALETCQSGLLVRRRVTIPILQATGKRFLTAVIGPLEKMAEGRA